MPAWLRARAGRCHQDDALLDQRPGQEAVQQLRMERAEHDVDLAGIQVAQQVRDQPGAERERDPGIAAAEPRERPRQVQRSQYQGRPDADVAASYRGQLGQVGAGLVELAEHGADPGQEQLPGVGERDPAGGALEQRGPELGLQPPDLRRDRGLRDAQLLGRAAEAAAAHDRLEVGELPQLH